MTTLYVASWEHIDIYRFIHPPPDDPAGRCMLPCTQEQAAQAEAVSARG